MKEETEYDVKIETKITGSIPMQTTYEDDPTLEQGKEKVVQKDIMVHIVKHIK